MSYSVKLAANEDIDTLVQLRLDFSDANNGPHPETYELRKANLKAILSGTLTATATPP